MPTSMPNAATILNVAHIGTGRHITGLCYHVTRFFRVGRRSFPRLELSQVQLGCNCGSQASAVQVDSIWPANKSQRSGAFSKQRCVSKDRSASLY